LGYERNPVLSSLASKKFKNPHGELTVGIALITAHQPTRSFQTLHQLDDCRRLAVQLGYRLELCDSRRLQNLEAVRTDWWERGIRGVLITNSTGHLPLLTSDWERFSVVGCGGHYFNPTHHMVKSDVAHGLLALWDEAQRRGYRRIGLAMMRHAERIQDDLVRVGVARQLMADAPVPLPVYDGPLTDEAGFLDWVRRVEPELVIGFPPVMHYWLTKAGRAVPRDLALLHYACPANDASSGWVEDDGLVLREGLKLLDECIRTGDLSVPQRPKVVQFTGYWNEGETCPYKENPPHLPLPQVLIQSDITASR
jgi:hypothetical protein